MRNGYLVALVYTSYFDCKTPFAYGNRARLRNERKVSR